MLQLRALDSIEDIYKTRYISEFKVIDMEGGKSGDSVSNILTKFSAIQNATK